MTPESNLSNAALKKSSRSTLSKHAIATLTSLIVAHGLASVAGAQSTPPASNASKTNAPSKLPEVVVTGEAEKSYQPPPPSSPIFTEPLRDIPQTITIIPQAVIQDQGATTLRDVLRNVSGISMQAGEGGGGLPGDNLSIRGFNARNDIYLDGIRDYGAYSRDPFNVEQVEVAKGPASANTGRGSTGGSINLVTKGPQLRSFYNGYAGFGSDNYQRLTMDLNQPLTKNPPEENSWIENSALRLNAMWTDADTPGRDVVTSERWAVAPSFAMGLGTSTRVTMNYMHQEQDNVPDYGIPWVPTGNIDPVLSNYINAAPPVNYDNFYGLKNYDFEDIVNDTATVIAEHDFNDSLSLRNLTRYGRTHRDSAITAPRFADIDPVTDGSQSTTVINRQLQRREIENEILANQSSLSWSFDTGPVEHATVSGVELSREDQDNRNSAQNANQPPTDIYNPNPNDLPLGPMPPITGAPTFIRADTLALFAFDTMKFGRQWELSGGVRYDHVKTDFQIGDNTDDMLSWRAGLVFKPRENGSIYLGAGTSFNPSVDGNTGLTAANAAINPEETTTFELGTKWDFLKERLSVNTAVFRTIKTNARTAGVNPGDPPFVLNGEQVVNGVEFGVAGQLTKDWQIIANYTYLHTEIEESNTPTEIGSGFSNAPEHSASLWTTYQLPWGIEIGGGVQYVGERLNNLSSNANVRTAPDYWLFDMMLAYEVNRHLTLRLNIYNLTDEDYIDRVGGGHFVPGAGRSGVLSANFSF